MGQCRRETKRLAPMWKNCRMNMRARLSGRSGGSVLTYGVVGFNTGVELGAGGYLGGGLTSKIFWEGLGGNVAYGSVQGE